MEIETKSTTSTISIEDTDIENMIIETEGIIEKLEETEKYLSTFSKLNSYTLPYSIVKDDKKMELINVLDILQNTSNASSFATNILAFLQNAHIISEKLSEENNKK